jgi:plasmid stabilization system protein ParE
MPRGVKEGSKRDRQYEHIKDSYEERGVSKDEAEERAARTVNKTRREHGETKAQRSRSHKKS